MKRFKIGPGQRKLGLVAVDPSVHQLDSPTNGSAISIRLPSWITHEWQPCPTVPDALPTF